MHSGGQATRIYCHVHSRCPMQEGNPEGHAAPGSVPVPQATRCKCQAADTVQECARQRTVAPKPLCWAITTRQEILSCFKVKGQSGFLHSMRSAVRVVVAGAGLGVSVGVGAGDGAGANSRSRCRCAACVGGGGRRAMPRVPSVRGAFVVWAGVTRSSSALVCS